MTSFNGEQTLARAIRTLWTAILVTVICGGIAAGAETLELKMDLQATPATTISTDPMYGNNVTTTYALTTPPNVSANLGDVDSLRVSSSFPTGQAITITPPQDGALSVYFSQEWWGTTGNLPFNPQSPTWTLTLTDRQGPMPAVTDSTVHVNRDGNQVFVEIWLEVTQTVTFTGLQVDMQGPFPDKGAKEYYVRDSGFSVTFSIAAGEDPFSSIVAFP